jgi:hypothetical protein
MVDAATIRGWAVALVIAVFDLAGIQVEVAATANEHASAAPSTAAVDRIVDGVAVLLQAGPVELELHVPADKLPDRTREGSWVIFDHVRGTWALDDALTERRTRELDERLDAIRRQRTGGRFAR